MGKWCFGAEEKGQGWGLSFAGLGLRGSEDQGERRPIDTYTVDFPRHDDALTLYSTVIVVTLHFCLFVIQYNIQLLWFQAARPIHTHTRTH